MRINARLFFLPQIELFEFKGEDLTDDEDGGIIRRIRKKGEGYSKPNEGAVVESKYITQIVNRFTYGRTEPFSQSTTPWYESEKYMAFLSFTK